MKRAFTSLALLAGLAACAGPGGMSPSGGLMYRVPDPATLTYLTGDTTNVDIDAGDMGSFRMRGTSTATIGVTFASGEGGVQVTATYEDLAASVSNPMGGAQSITEDDVDGNIVFTMDSRGRSTVGSLPGLTMEAESMASPYTFIHEFFPRLPGGAVNPGDMWTDTISYDGSMSSGDMSTNSVLTYTLVGDTVVNGVTLLKVTYEGEADVVGSGVQEGMEVVQRAAGSVQGMFLWDAARSVMVGSETTANMRGTVEIPGAGMPPFPLRMTGTSKTSLQGG